MRSSDILIYDEFYYANEQTARAKSLATPPVAKMVHGKCGS